MDEIVVDFKEESKELIGQLNQILAECEGNFDKRIRLEEYGQIVDRIMGGSKSLAMVFDDTTHIDKIGSYAELCKLVGYKASQIENNVPFYDIVVGLLMDATEMLEEISNSLATPQEKDIKDLLSKTFLERLQWVSQQFDENTRGTVAIDQTGKKKTGQSEIDDLLASMGIGG